METRGVAGQRRSLGGGGLPEVDECTPDLLYIGSAIWSAESWATFPLP